MSSVRLQTAYPRTTSVDFLNRCSPKISAFYYYWDSKRNGRVMPSRADLDPIEMKVYLPNIVVVDVQRDPRRLVYRLVGTKSVELAGRDPTGRSVEEGFVGSALADALENYRLVTEEKKFVYDWDDVPSYSGLMRRSEALLLPLSSDGDVVDKVIIYLETQSS